MKSLKEKCSELQAVIEILELQITTLQGSCNHENLIEIPTKFPFYRLECSNCGYKLNSWDMRELQIAKSKQGDGTLGSVLKSIADTYNELEEANQPDSNEQENE